jgi:acetyl-CoA carboxylase biotin carboxyl carrier protein
MQWRGSSGSNHERAEFMPAAKDISVDGDLVRQLASLLEETGLSEIEYSVGDRRIRVAKAVAQALAMPAMAAALPAAPAASGASTPTVLAEHPGAVKSPMVGTAYLAPQPEAPPFVKIGDAVAEGQVIMIIEAMKVMNQIRAKRGGTVREVVVGDGEPVEFGQILMIIE